MTKQKPVIKIPFYTEGPFKGLAGYPTGYWSTEWRDNHVFMDHLLFDGFERGRNAAHAVLKSTANGERYEMFLRDLEDVIKRMGFTNGGGLAAYFTFVKRGANYGIRLATEDEQP